MYLEVLKDIDYVTMITNLSNDFDIKRIVIIKIRDVDRYNNRWSKNQRPSIRSSFVECRLEGMLHVM